MNNIKNQSRLADYFSIVGLPPQLTAVINNSEEIKEKYDNNNDNKKNKNDYELERCKLLDSNLEFEYSQQRYLSDKKDPIVDLAILNKNLNETVPIGYECVWLTPNGNSANLVSESLFKSNEIFLCYKRGRNKPPITDIGVLYENKEVVMDGCIDIKETIGKNSANLNRSNFNTDNVYVTYRRGNDLACNSLAVSDICVINKSKVHYIIILN